jgi:hypothetical protein
VIVGRVSFGAGFAIFVIFFGISLVEPLRTGSWVEVVFWLGLGILFFVADNLRRPTRGITRTETP